MKIALLGYGKEGQSTENYFKKHHDDLECDVFENFTPEEISQKYFSNYDYVFRSPSVPPLNLPNETSVTKYFFDHCPCPIIGVTATKGKGTTCSFIASLLKAHHDDVYLVGNIGTPASDILDDLKPTSVVVYEMSSFQLWDLQKSPHIAVLGQLEPDHLNVHKDMADYLNAKANITKYQSENDYLVYFKNNPETVKIAEKSHATLVAYPSVIPAEIQNAITIPGKHNQDNAIAAITAVACYKNLSLEDYLNKYQSEIISGLQNFHGLPHRLEFLRELNQVKYYDDNFSTNPSSTRVAINSFPNDNLVVIIGGRDKTDNQDLPEIYEILQTENIKKIILLGESGHALAKKYQDDRFIITESLQEAVNTARQEAEALSPSIVLMSPSAASFDMFENVYDRGDQFKRLIGDL
ncbi:UDP-N-acetylmuramoyl-L-alanine--D-glutamate ligase [Candidatus Saccharibacteria bacterium]|nr:UDP-N-acetylmuramoyl-L-alanine--D-glutamate ligase [Candidatus Saccharibacteria bacterium]